MSECKCGRELRRGEKQCPACAAKKAHGWKRVVEGGFTFILLVLAGVWKILKGAKSV